MADVLVKERFNPFLDKVREDNYLGYSRGAKSKEFAVKESPNKVDNTVFAASQRKTVDTPQRDRYVSPVMVDRSDGILIGGLGDVAAGAIVTGDNIFKQKIKDDITEQVDEIRDEFGVGAAAAVYGDAKGPIPETLRQQASYLDDLAEAHANGTLRDSHYWAKLDMVARNMRTKHPFYRDYIDSVLSKQTGSLPANALKRALESEATSENSETSKLQKLEKELVTSREPGKNLLQAIPDYYQRREAGDPYTYDEVLQKVAHSTKVAADRQWRIDNINERKLAGEETKEYARKSATDEVFHQFDNLFQTATGPLAKDWKEFDTLYKQRIKDTNKGQTPLTGEQENELRATWMPLRQAHLDTLNHILFKEQTTSSGETFVYATELGSAGVEAVMKSANQYLDNLESGLIGENFGILGYTKAWSEATKTGDVAGILSMSEPARKLSAIREVYGDTAAEKVLSTNVEFQNASTKAINDYALMDMTGAGADAPMSEKFLPDNPEHNQALITRSKEIITDATQPATLRGKTALSVFSGDSLSRIEPSKRTEFYAKYATPEFAASMVKLRDEGQTEAFNKYMQWTTQGFTSLFRQDALEAQSIAVNRSHMNLAFNPDLMQFEVQDTGSPLSDMTALRWNHPDGIATNIGAIVEATVMEPMARRALTRFNQQVLGYANVIKATGNDPQLALGVVFASLGIDPSAPKDRSTLIGNVQQVIAESIPNYNQIHQAVNAGINPIGALAAYGGSSVLNAYNPKVRELGDTIGSVEAPGGYSQVYNNMKTGLDVPLQNAPLRDVFKAQRNMLAQGSKSSAVGKYQFTQATLSRITDKLGFTGDETFSPEVQDTLFLELAKERGLERFMAGTISKEEFAKNLSKEWAALPNPYTGKSYYQGIAGNKSLIKVKEFLDTLERLRDG